MIPTAPPPVSLAEPDLVARARHGDPDALGAIYAAHGRALMALAYRLLRSAHDAEDVLHDVFLGLPEALRRYEERGGLGSWLKRVTARVALNRLRSRARSREVDLPAPDAVVSAGAADTPDRLDVLALQSAI